MMGMYIAVGPTPVDVNDHTVHACGPTVFNHRIMTVSIGLTTFREQRTWHTQWLEWFPVFYKNMQRIKTLSKSKLLPISKKTNNYFLD